MFTVADLATLLADYPPDSPLGMLMISRSGRFLDVDAAPLATIQAARDDTGTVTALWLAAVIPDTVNSIPRGISRRQPNALTNIEMMDSAPELISWPCACGEILTATPGDYWPSDHTCHCPTP